MSERSETLRYTSSTPERLDKILVAHLPEFSRARLQKLIKEGHVLVDGITAQKSGLMVEKDQSIEIQIPKAQSVDLIPEDIPLDIIFENNDLIVVNKPAGMVVHPAAGHREGTLVHAALAHAPDIEGVGGKLRPGVVHRLDKDTSGIILLAKNDRTHQWLQDQFRLRKVKKTYLALVDGHPPTAIGRIETAIGRSTKYRNQMAVVQAEKGRSAVTEYSVLENFTKHSLIEVHPVTGRTHQIRLHLEFIGCPVVGDRFYGRKRPTLPLERHFLHAFKLEISLPDGDVARNFEAPLPKDLVHLLEKLRIN